MKQIYDQNYDSIVENIIDSNSNGLFFYNQYGENERFNRFREQYYTRYFTEPFLSQSQPIHCYGIK
jgi:hypothetical protein